jgi:hypothetical protein
MKRIFTLVAFASLTSIANAQTINETLEDYTSVSELTGSCWTLSGAGFSTASYFNGANSFVIIPTTSTSTNLTSNNAKITTPYVNWLPNSTINFSYKINNKLSTQADRTIQIGLLSIGGTFTPLFSKPLDKNTPYNTSQLFSYTLTALPAEPVQKLVINVTGNGDGNTYLFIDDLSITSASYNRSYPYDCKAAAAITLPIKLTNFSGCLVENKPQLKWSVAENETGEHFEIEKSTDGLNYSVIGVVPVTSKVGAESYVFSENIALAGGAYYRIKVVNKDDSRAYTKFISLKNDGKTLASAITLMLNPVQTTLSFQFVASVSEDAIVSIYNVTGVKVQTFTIKMQKGVNSILHPLDSRIGRGTYILEVSSNTQRSAIKLTK